MTTTYCIILLASILLIFSSCVLALWSIVFARKRMPYEQLLDDRAQEEFLANLSKNNA